MNVTLFGRTSSLAAGLVYLAFLLPIHADTDDMQLPDLTVRGQTGGPHSSFGKFRDRSRSVLNFKPKTHVRDTNLAVLFAGESMVPGAQMWMYPDGSGYPMPSMSDARAKNGRYSLEVRLKPDSYSGGAVCSPSPIDLKPFLGKGFLDLWVQGASGQEVFSIGLLDNGNNAIGRPLQVWVSSRSFGKITKDDWRHIRVPLKAFGLRGSYWSEEIGARVFSALNWTSISCFSFDIDKDRFKSFQVWMDDVAIYKTGPKDSAAGGTPYSLSNEDFDDFSAGSAKDSK
jgi:hypothetical protein